MEIVVNKAGFSKCLLQKVFGLPLNHLMPLWAATDRVGHDSCNHNT